MSRFLVAIDRRHGRRLPPEALEDLGQDVAVTVLEQLPRYLALAPLEAWVHRICRLSYMNAVRSRRRDADRVRSLEDWEPPVENAGFAALEHEEQMLLALERLGGIEAEIIWARQVDDLDFETIGERLGEKAATVKTRYYRGMKRLKEILSKEEGSGD